MRERGNPSARADGCKSSTTSVPVLPNGKTAAPSPRKTGPTSLETSLPSIPRTKGRALTSPLPYATIWALREEQPLSTGALWEFYRIPRGPWSKYGDNNPFVNAGLGAGKKSLQLREDRLRQQQEAIQRELLKDPAKLRRELQG